MSSSPPSDSSLPPTEYRSESFALLRQYCVRWKKPLLWLAVLLSPVTIGITAILVLSKAPTPLEITELPADTPPAPSSPPIIAAPPAPPPLPLFKPSELNYTPIPQAPHLQPSLPATPPPPPAATYLIAFIELQKAFFSGQPFAFALEQFLATAPQSRLIQQQGRVLHKAATEGVADLFTLRQQFHALAGKAVALSTDPSFLQGRAKWFAYLSRWIRIRDKNDALLEQETPEAWVAQAERALEKQQLEQALMWTRKLPPSAQEYLKSWQLAAQSRLDAEAALQQLQHYLSQDERLK